MKKLDPLTRHHLHNKKIVRVYPLEIIGYGALDRRQFQPRSMASHGGMKKYYRKYEISNYIQQ